MLVIAMGSGLQLSNFNFTYFHAIKQFSSHTTEADTRSPPLCLNQNKQNNASKRISLLFFSWIAKNLAVGQKLEQRRTSRKVFKNP